MKRIIISVLLVAAVGTILSGCGIQRMVKCRNKEKLNVYNWGEYIEGEAITDFENKYDVCVTYSTFTDNETAITKMKTEKFDVVFPSDYAVEQLKSEELIEKIDWSKLSVNKDTVFADDLMKIINKMKEEFNYDFLEYAIPYFWGSVGIVYNSEKVLLSALEEQNWNILKDPSYDSVFYDSSRDAYMVALKQLGYSMNSENMEEITSATNWLMDTKEKMGQKFTLLTDEILDTMPNEEYDLAVSYSGDANYIMDKNGKMKFFKPKGTNVWVDGIVIPKNALNKDLAYKFIDFLLTDEIATRNTDDIGYSSPVKSVYEEMTKVGGKYEYLNDSYKITVGEDDEMFRYLGASLKSHIENEWLKIKSQK